MKFFSEFGSCFGGPTAAQSAESVAQPPVVKDSASSRASRLTNWKPALTVILEEGAVSELAVRRAVEGKANRSQKKTKERSSRSYAAADDFYAYRKKELMIAAANPGFMPTPYLF